MKKLLVILTVFFAAIGTDTFGQTQAQQIDKYFKTDSIAPARKQSPGFFKRFGDAVIKSDPETLQRVHYVLRQLPFTWFQNDSQLRQYERDFILMIQEDIGQGLPYLYHQGLVLNP